MNVPRPRCIDSSAATAGGVAGAGAGPRCGVIGILVPALRGLVGRASVSDMPVNGSANGCTAVPSDELGSDKRSCGIASDGGGTMDGPV